MGRQHQRIGTVGENQYWQKEIVVYWKGFLGKFREVLQHAWQQNMNIHLEDRVSTKIARRELHKSNIHGRAATAKLLITESTTQICKGWCHGRTSKRALYGQMSRPSHCSLYQEAFTFRENSRKPRIRNAWFQQWTYNVTTTVTMQLLRQNCHTVLNNYFLAALQLYFTDTH
jgi:hypothetical protein